MPQQIDDSNGVPQSKERLLADNEASKLTEFDDQGADSVRLEEPDAENPMHSEENDPEDSGLKTLDLPEVGFSRGGLEKQPHMEAGTCEHFRLENGINLYVVPRPGSPVLAVMAGFAAGGHEDPPRREGLAHLLEHLNAGFLFGGFGNTSPGGIFTFGGRGNAFTGTENTFYTMEVPVNVAEQVIDRMLDRLLQADLPLCNVESEKKVIGREISERNTDEMNYRMFSSFYDAPSAVRKVVGTQLSIKSVSADELISFRSKYYRSSNLTLTIAGDVDIPILIDQIASFGNKPETQVQRPVRPQPDRSTDKEKVIVDYLTTLSFRRDKIVFGFERIHPNSFREAVERRAVEEYIYRLIYDELREHGLVYGMFRCSTEEVVGFETSASKFGGRKVYTLVRDFLNRPVEEDRFLSARQRYLGELTMGLESSLEQANRVLEYVEAGFPVGPAVEEIKIVKEMDYKRFLELEYQCVNVKHRLARIYTGSCHVYMRLQLPLLNLLPPKKFSFSSILYPPYPKI
jgi:predicted Zn-dependent peptidase